MTLDSQSSVYSVLVSSASNGLKYNLAKSVSNHPLNVPHLFTLTFKFGNKAPVHISPVHVWFGAGTIKISSFVCLVGIGLGIGTYAVYKIYKKVFPIGVGSLPTFLKKSNREAAKVDKIKINVSSTSNNDDEISDICRRHSQNSERHCRRRKVARPKHATPSTDSDTELNRLKSGSPIDTKPLRILRHSSDLGFISMKSSQLLPQHQTSEDKSSTNLGLKSSYNLVDDHRGKRFVITPINAEEEEARLQLAIDHPLRCTSVTGHRRKQSTPDDLDGNLLDLSEFISEDQTRRSSGRSCPTDSKESGSDSDRTGMSLSQPSSEMFETARDIVLSGTLTEMEQLQSQLDLLSNDVDDLNCEMESLQKREDPVETVSRRYTLGAEEALTANKNKLRDVSSKKINKNRSRFLRKLDFQNSLSTGNKTRSCDLLGSDRSEDGVIALVENTDLALDSGSGFIDSLISNVCSELDRLSSEASSSYGIVRLSDVSDGSIYNEQILENWSEPLPRNAANQTFVVKRQSVESKGAKRKKIDFDLTDDLYIDDELISPSSNRKKNSTVSFDMINSTDQFMVRPRSMGSSNDSRYKTPDRSFATNLASPWSDGRMNYFHHLVSRDGRMNLVNNNLNINLISDLLFLSSGDGPLSPRTSDFLATCMESPDRASSNLDPKAIRKFMEKIGEAVINFGRSTVPLKKCSGKACSTPNGLTSDRGHLQIFQRAVEKLCEPFPYWVVKNLEEPTDVVEYVERTFCANTESHICLGYKQIVKLTGARHVCSVRKDNFCIIRAALCQSIISDKLKSFGRMFSKDREKFLRVFQGNEYLKSSSFSNRIPFNKGSEMDVLKSCFDLLLSVVISQEAIHSKVHDPTQREEELRSLLDGLFNGCPIVDMHLMEAVKMVMVVEAIELYKSFDSFPLQSKSLAWAIFSGKSTQNPEQLFKNRICAIGDIQVLNEVETSLLAHSLKIKLEILRPAQFLGHSDGFVSHYPDEGADDCEKVTLVQEVDNSFILLLQ